MTEYRTYFIRAKKFATDLKATIKFMNMETAGQHFATDGFIGAMILCGMDDPYDTEMANDDLCTSFSHEQTEQYGRYSEAKTQDRLSSQLYDQILRPLDACSKYMVEHYPLKKNEHGQILDNDGQLLTDGHQEDAHAASETLKTVNKLLSAVKELLKNYHPDLWEKYRGKDSTSIETRQELELNVKLSTFQRLFLIRLLQKEGLFPKKQLAQSYKSELEFIGAITGLTYEGHLKKADVEVSKLYRNELSVNQYRVRIKDIKAVKDMISVMELPKVYDTILKYEQCALKKLETE